MSTGIPLTLYCIECGIGLDYTPALASDHIPLVGDVRTFRLGVDQHVCSPPLPPRPVEQSEATYTPPKDPL